MRYLSLLLLCGSLCLAQSNSAPAAPSGVRFNVDMLDKTIDPCTDFYAYACSKWQAQNPIPSDRSTWGRFNELQERGENVIREILEKYSAERLESLVEYFSRISRMTFSPRSCNSLKRPQVDRSLGIGFWACHLLQA